MRHVGPRLSGLGLPTRPRRLRRRCRVGAVGRRLRIRPRGPSRRRSGRRLGVRRCLWAPTPSRTPATSAPGPAVFHADRMPDRGRRRAATGSDRRGRLVVGKRCVSSEEAVDLLTFVPSTSQRGGGELRVVPGVVPGRQADQSAYGAGHAVVPRARTQERRPADLTAPHHHGDTARLSPGRAICPTLATLGAGFDGSVTAMCQPGELSTGVSPAAARPRRPARGDGRRVGGAGRAWSGCC
jgi:hypothetical protein